MNEPWFGLGVAVAFGPVLGLLGSAYGVVSGQAGRTGWGRGWAVGLCWAALVYAGGLLSAGLVARAVGQPDHVWFSLGLVGLIGVCVFGPLAAAAGRQFQELEDRRMQAADLG